MPHIIFAGRKENESEAGQESRRAGRLTLKLQRAGLLSARAQKAVNGPGSSTCGGHISQASMGTGDSKRAFCFL